MPVTIAPTSSYSLGSISPPAIEWVRNYTGKYPADEADLILQSNDGGYAIAGVIGAHHYSVSAGWLVKTDNLGNVEWNQTFEVTSGNLTFRLEGVAGLVRTSDGFAVAGTESWFPNGPGMEDSIGTVAILFKTDVLGNLEWNQTYPYISHVTSMVHTTDGGYALTGDHSMLKTNALGIVQWHKSYEDNVFKPNIENQALLSIVQTTDGGYALLTSNNILFKINPSGDFQWKQNDQANTSDTSTPTDLIGHPELGRISSFVQTIDGGYALGGTMYIANSGVATSAVLIKTDFEGAVEWCKAYDPIGSRSSSLIQTSDGGYAFAGTVPGYGNYPANFVWLVKTDSLGGLQWSQNNKDAAVVFSVHSGGGIFSANSLIETNDGGFLIAGSLDPSIILLNTAYYVVKTESALPPPSSTPTLTPVVTSTAPPNAFNEQILTAGIVFVVIALGLAVYALKRTWKKPQEP